MEFFATHPVDDGKPLLVEAPTFPQHVGSNVGAQSCLWLNGIPTPSRERVVPLPTTATTSAVPLSYRDRLRASGCGAFQRAYDVGLMPKSARQEIPQIPQHFQLGQFQQAFAAPQCPVCKSLMQWSDYAQGVYTDGWDCSNVSTCGESFPESSGAHRWCCSEFCEIDFCGKCYQPPTAWGAVATQQLELHTQPVAQGQRDMDVVCRQTPAIQVQVKSPISIDAPAIDIAAPSDVVSKMSPLKENETKLNSCQSLPTKPHCTSKVLVKMEAQNDRIGERLPGRWLAAWDQASRNHYYRDTVTNEVTWDLPTEWKEELKRTVQYLAVRSYVPSESDRRTGLCVRVTHGERVVLESETLDGWVVGSVIPEPGESVRLGRLPRKVLSDDPVSNPKCLAKGARVRVIHEFTSPANGYLSASIGEMLIVQYHAEPFVWAWAESAQDPNRNGWIPEAVLARAWQ